MFSSNDEAYRPTCPKPVHPTEFWGDYKKPNAQLVVDALEEALESRGYPKGLMFHSDQGSQYASRRFRRVLWRHPIVQSMSRRGNCWDNAPMDRLFFDCRVSHPWM